MTHVNVVAEGMRVPQPDALRTNPADDPVEEQPPDPVPPLRTGAAAARTTHRETSCTRSAYS